jgi:Fur family ferric uptake transcriptional regulator
MNLNPQSPIHLTRQRSLVLEILKENRGHLDAESLFQKAKARKAKISLATIYRSLAFLRQARMIQEHRLGENHGHFETTRRTLHHHFTCLKCGRIVEFHSPQVMNAARSLCRRQGLQVIEIRLDLQGYCQTCRQEPLDCQ